MLFGTPYVCVPIELKYNTKMSFAKRMTYLLTGNLQMINQFFKFVTVHVLVGVNFFLFFFQE